MTTLAALLIVELTLSLPYPAGMTGAPAAALSSISLIMLLYAAADGTMRRGGFLSRFTYLIVLGWFFSRWASWAVSVEEIYLAAGPGGPTLALTALFIVVAPLGLLLCPMLAMARER